MSFVETCRQLIAIDSTPSAGSVEVCNWLAQYAKSRGLFVEEFEESYNGIEQKNLLISTTESPQLHNNLILQGHVDTSDPGPITFWTREGLFPFEATIKEGSIFGLGSANSKLDLLCKIESLADYAGKTFSKKTPIVAATYGEEIGMHGMLRLIRRGKLKNSWALIAEPTNLALVYAGKGYAAVEIAIPFSEQERSFRAVQEDKEGVSTQSKIFVGKSAISSDPTKGESAIIKMFEYLKQLPDGVVILNIDGGVSINSVPSDAMIEFDLSSEIQDSMLHRILRVYDELKNLEVEFSKYGDDNFEYPLPTLNIGIIRTSEDDVVIQGSCRIPPSVSDEVYQRWILDLQLACTRVGASVKVVDYKHPHKTEIDSAFFMICKEAARQTLKKVEQRTQGNTNEASLLSRVGVECVSFGAGAREGNVSTPQEHVALGELEAAKLFYREIIERVCV